jgi:ferredoxin-NADP reductase
MPQKLRCEVEDIIPHGERVYSLILRPERPVGRFLPGQFLHLALDEFQPGDFWPDSRPFSIASTPTELDRLRITYAVKGQFTSRMEQELHPGISVWIKLPYGEFTIQPGSGACLLAGGTGVTAFTAFLAGLSTECPNPIWLLYGARQPELLIYRSMLEQSASRCSNLHAWFLAEHSTGNAGCLRGRIELERVWAFVPFPLEVDYYLSGPPEMLCSLSKSLRENGVPAGQVHIDAWE